MTEIRSVVNAGEQWQWGSSIIEGERGSGFSFSTDEPGTAAAFVLCEHAIDINNLEGTEAEVGDGVWH